MQQENADRVQELERKVYMYIYTIYIHIDRVQELERKVLLYYILYYIPCAGAPAQGGLLPSPSHPRGPRRPTPSPAHAAAR